jgi:hypothetical protein
MNKRTVVAIEPGFDELMTIKLYKAPDLIEGARVPHLFDCDPEKMLSWAQPDAVKAHGQMIFSKLNDHQAIKSALEFALHAPPGQVHSIYFKVDVNDAERLCWETLCNDQGKFLALDRRWPIARMADSVVDRPIPAVHDFVPPLKIMAFFAAMGIDGQPEWESLKRAVKNGRRADFPIEVMVYVGQQSLINAIEDEILNEGLTGVRVQPLPELTGDIETAVEDFAPHLVHFFCHGSTAHGVAELELATLLDELQQKQSGSVRLQVNQLVNIPAMERAWLVTLNCCEGGRATGDLHSMAHSLVASGIPAAVGSLEPIDAADAHDFSTYFYPTIFSNLRKILADNPDGKSSELEWAEALRSPRTGLCERHNNDPGNYRQWTLPVLYVRPEPFYVKRAAVGIDSEDLRLMKIRAETVAGALRALPPDTPEEVRTQLLALLKDFPDSLKTDRFGNFGDEGSGLQVQPSTIVLDGNVPVNILAGDNG